MSKRRLLKWTWPLFFATVLYVGRVGAETVTVGYPAVSEGFGPLWVAEKAGFFKKYGLDVRPLYVRGGGLITTALISGELNIGNVSLSAPIGAWTQGADLVAVAVDSRTIPYYVMGPRSIQTPADLRGKKIASWSYGTMPDIVLRMALRHHKLEPGKDVLILQSAPGQFLTAMQAGAAESALLTGSEIFLAQKLGFHTIIDLTTLPIHFAGTGIVVTKQYLQKNRKTVKDFLKGWIEGVHKYKTDGEFALDTLGKQIRRGDREILAKGYEWYANAMVEVPTVLPEGVQSVLNGLDRVTFKRTNPDVKDFVDNSLIEELEKEGFIRQLYSKK